ncbi:antibiotic biosynthesis monooxygenase [Acetobacter musti]|uniref:Antibiotic biosynthesis monooxygenase n=1 Tax=Acetobacter musti TaxID=864732 RepID=A0ABX0JQX2_9PROT|nr:putative quinol monooxygenase [Acetobacter musti]NHN85712.1 antibiotic biosynthesis monooxygenase [Acetobacter musti]
MTEKPITVVATLHLWPQHQDKALEAMAACILASRQETTNSGYHCRRDAHDPHCFVFIEHWASVAAIHEHEKTPHFLAMKQVLNKALSKPMDVRLLEDTDLLP